MWCFFDESYPDEGGVASVVACLMRTETIRSLDTVFYSAQRKHWGAKQARDLKREVKGMTVLSKNSFKMLKKFRHSTSQQVAGDILRGCAELPPEKSIRIFGAAIYGEKDILKRVRRDRLAFPVVAILQAVSQAAKEMANDRTVNLVFDEKLADRDVSISLRRFVAGVRLTNVSHYPLIGVSHVTPGIQLADICAYILGRRAVGDKLFGPWLSRVRQLEWNGEVGGVQRLGIQRWDAGADGMVTVRKKWE